MMHVYILREALPLSMYTHTLYTDIGKHVTMLDIVNRLCGHTYEYGTT